MRRNKYHFQLKDYAVAACHVLKSVSPQRMETTPHDTHCILCKQGLNLGWANPLTFREWFAVASGIIDNNTHSNLKQLTT